MKDAAPVDEENTLNPHPRSLPFVCAHYPAHLLGTTSPISHSHSTVYISFVCLYLSNAVQAIASLSLRNFFTLRHLSLAQRHSLRPCST